MAYTKFLSLVLCYPHYKIIHLASHHVRAATDTDKNTAWMNESFWAYWWRTIPQSAKCAWRIEAARTKKLSDSSLAKLYKNRFLRALVCQFVFFLLIPVWLGFTAAIFVIGQVIGAHFILEAINYIQHYSLKRAVKNGEYEELDGSHSWDSYHLISNYFTYRVGHHSFHHVHPHLPYYALGLEANAPRLPISYFWAIGMVAVPPLWKKLTDPILASAGRIQRT